MSFLTDPHAWIRPGLPGLLTAIALAVAVPWAVVAAAARRRPVPVPVRVRVEESGRPRRL